MICRIGQFDPFDGPKADIRAATGGKIFSTVEPNVQGGENVSFSLKHPLPVLERNPISVSFHHVPPRRVLNKIL
jgi:hypothetical protein